MINHVSFSCGLDVGDERFHAAVVLAPVVNDIFQLNRIGCEIAEVFRAVRPGAHVLVFCSNDDVDLWGVALRTAGFELRDTIQINYSGDAVRVTGSPVLLVRKPLIEKTVALNVLNWETGGINIDGSRIPSGDDHRQKCESVVGLASNRNGSCYGSWTGERGSSYHEGGRFPSNILFGQQASLILDEQSGVSRSRKGRPLSGRSGRGRGFKRTGTEYADVGGVSRFFFVANDDEGTTFQLGRCEFVDYLVGLITPAFGKLLWRDIRFLLTD